MARPHKYNYSWKINPVLYVFICCILTSCVNNNTNHQSHSLNLSGVKIGDQVWAATSLDVVTFRNGDSIQEVKSNEEWVRAGKEGKPAWCYYENDVEKGKTYGRMYNWYSVNDPLKKNAEAAEFLEKTGIPNGLLEKGTTKMQLPRQTSKKRKK